AGHRLLSGRDDRNGRRGAVADPRPGGNHRGAGALEGIVGRESLAAHQARLRYPPVSVLIRITSPISMNGGTRVFKPVSSSASFIWLVAVAPLMPGCVSVTFRSTVLGRS